ncbi:MAG: FGGY family carbohydrate kinase [Acidobacteriota bacterium]
MSVLGLGIDASTQSLTLLVLDASSAEIVARSSVRFDDDLPGWGTLGGQLPNQDERIGEAPPLLWIEALDLALRKLSANVDLSLVRAVAVAGQQHGSVYLNGSAERTLGTLTPTLPASQQLRSALARPVAPLWTDSRTSVECGEIRGHLGGATSAAKLTGSDLYERFTGPQIRWFAKNEPEAWTDTSHVALVSSFLTGVLAGRLAPLDWGDAAGTNLMNVRRGAWSSTAIEATVADLERRLPDLEPPAHCAGSLSPYFCERFGLPAGCRVGIGVGDNPAAALGAGLREPGQALLSLGTSDTVSVLGRDLPAVEHGHLFVAPSGHDLALLCFRNGSLAREAVRDRFGLDWAGFDETVLGTPPGCEGHHLLPWFEPEIVPRTVGQGAVHSPGFPTEDAGTYCRALLEGQAMAIERHLSPLGRLTELRAVGGGSQSRALLQVVADVLDCPVQPHSTPDGAGLGAALQALRFVLSRDAWEELADSATAVTAPRINPRQAEVYVALKEASRRLASEALASRSAIAEAS